jgi:hypothetical protein
MEIAERKGRTKERTMNKATAGKMVSAQNVRAGDMLVVGATVPAVRVMRVMTCMDGSIRMLTTGPEQRMPGQVRVRLAN